MFRNFPDLGGKEADDNRLMTEADDLNMSVIVNNPGAYRSVCVEIELDALAVNTLLQSHHVHDIEGTAGSVAFDVMPQSSLEEMLTSVPGSGSLASYDETALAYNAFRVLRTMVAAWLRDVSQYRNVFADYQIIHFYRWLRSSNALLYDPALRKTLLNLMKKLFMQLVAEFKRLGAIVIHADFNRVIICTKKRSLEDAKAYVDYVTSTIRQKELFHSIDMKMTHSWDFLLWCDPSNFGGIRSKITENKASLEDGMDYIDDEEEDDTPEIEMNWNMANYLPEGGAIQKNFNTVIAGYITANHQFIQEEAQRVAPGQTPIRKRTNSSQSQTPRRLSQVTGEPLTAAEYAQDLIKGELTQRLFAVTQKIHKKLPPETGLEPGEESAFPQLPGSHLKLTHPALEFVKALCKVLSLDNSISEETNQLRRNLLKLIGVGEFSDLADWRDPCISFILPEVICKQCNHCRDIDLCKDPHVSQENQPVWLCASNECQTPYDTQEIEHQLIDAINRKIMGYTLQDLQCLKCKGIKMMNLTTHCSCAGKFKTLQDGGEIRKLLRTFKSIAVHYNMPLLQEVVEWNMK